MTSIEQKIDIKVNVSASAFGLGDVVAIGVTGRRGEIRSILFETDCNVCYRVAFVNKAGELTKEWFYASELERWEEPEAATP